MAKFRGYNLVKVYLNDDEMAKVDLTIQYFKLKKSGPQSYNALFIWAFDRLIESDQALKAFIENSLAFVKRIQEQPQQAGQEAGGNA
ncbi:MAG: hypothetical protein RXO24_07030 [Acidilobus sp.]